MKLSKEQRSEIAKKAVATRKQNRAEEKATEQEQLELRSKAYYTLTDDQQLDMYTTLHFPISDTLTDRIHEVIDDAEEEVKEAVRDFLRSGFTAVQIIGCAEENGFNKWDSDFGEINITDIVTAVTLEDEFQDEKYDNATDTFVWHKLDKALAELKEAVATGK